MKLQNRAACDITFLDCDTDSGYLFELLRGQNLFRLTEIDRATMVDRSLHRLAPEYLCSRLTTRVLALTTYQKPLTPLTLVGAHRATYRFYSV